MSGRDVIDLTLMGRGYDRTEGTSDAILSALRAAGYAVVPMEPTEATLLSMWTAFHNTADRRSAMARVYHAATAAAQEPTP